MSKTTSLIISAVTALITSRAMFAFINDPEGPNLLVVTVLAVILYFPSLFAYKILGSSSYLKKSLLAILIQMLFAAIVFQLLNYF